MTVTLTVGMRRQCGTEWGYRLHALNGEPYCDDCRAACAAAACRRRRAKGIPPRQPARCGTPSGYTRHINTGTEPCDLCRAAHASNMHTYRRRRNRKPISTRMWIRDILETWDGEWFTTTQLTAAVGDLSEASGPTIRRALSRLINAAPDWLDTDIDDGERRFRARERSYLWT